MVPQNFVTHINGNMDKLTILLHFKNFKGQNWTKTMF